MTKNPKWFWPALVLSGLVALFTGTRKSPGNASGP